MSEHGHDAGHSHAVAEHEDGHRGDTSPGLNFEKEELHFFEAEDSGAGKNIGLLLAFTFCILLGLMTFVTIWTFRHRSVGHDPHETPAATDSAEHH